MHSQMERSRQNIYETITSKLLAAIEINPGDTVMPWQRVGTRPVLPTNAVTGQAYRGVNIAGRTPRHLRRRQGARGRDLSRRLPDRSGRSFRRLMRGRSMLRDRQSVARDQRTSSRPEVNRRRGRTVGASPRRVGRSCGRPLLVPSATHDLRSAKGVEPVLARAAWVAAQPAR
jgi:hypothetical protein